MAYIDKDKIPYYLDTSEEAPMEGRKIAFKSDIDKIPPADVVEVVRCKECGMKGAAFCMAGDFPLTEKTKNNFCSYGERRAEE